MSRRIGQIIKRGENRHLVRIYAGTDASGKRHYFNKTILGTKKDADQWMMNAIRRQQNGEPLEQSAETFGDYFTQWLRDRAQQLRPRTIEQYQVIADYYLLPALGRKRLADLRPDQIQKLYTDLAERGLSNATIRLAQAILSACLRQALRQEKIRRDPLRAIVLPRKTRREMKSLTSEQVQALRQAMNDDPQRLLIVFLLVTGCRPGEALALRWSDVNRETGLVRIQRNLVFLQSGEWRFEEPKTKAGRRTLPLAGEIMKALGEHRRTQQQQRLKMGAAWQNHDLIFPDETGCPQTLNVVRKVFKRALKAAGLPEEMRLYDLRHSSASLLMAAGIHPKVVSERLRHSSVALTLDVYSHVLPGLQEAASEQLEKSIFQ